MTSVKPNHLKLTLNNKIFSQMKKKYQLIIEHKIMGFLAQWHMMTK